MSKEEAGVLWRYSRLKLEKKKAKQEVKELKSLTLRYSFIIINSGHDRGCY